MKLSDLNNTSRAECRLALKYGFKPIPDPKRGRGWYKFIKGNRTVWLAAVPGGTRPPRWVSADMLNGSYSNHEYHDQLAEGIRRPLGMDHRPL